MSFALISGASSGIGKEFAHLLAARGYDLVLVSRKGDKLNEVKVDIEFKFDVKVVTEPIDLSEIGAAEALFNRITDRGVEIDVLINNAGFGKYGNFLKYDSDVYERMIVLNTITPTSLMLLFGRKMVERGKGWILNVSSTAAFQPLPYFAVYGATKSYMLKLSKALYEEFHNKGITVTALCPGPTKTNFGKTAETVGTKMFNPAGLADAKFVAEKGLKGLFSGRRVVVCGKFNNILAFLAKIMPDRIVLKISSRIMKRKS